MVTVSATEFAKDIEQYEEKAREEPVAITRSNQTSGYFISPQEYAEYQRLKQYARRAYHISEIPSEIADAIERASMNPEHNHLNSLLDD